MRNRADKVSYRSGRDPQGEAPHPPLDTVVFSAVDAVSSRPVIDPFPEPTMELPYGESYERLEVHIGVALRVCIIAFMLACFTAAAILLWWSVNG